jgi:heme exporter protein D
MGFFDDFTNIILAVVGLVIVYALFERSRIIWQARRKRERQDRAHRKDAKER